MKNITEHAILEFIENIRSGDLIKARLVLDHLPELDRKGQKKILFELSKCNSELAIPLLAFLNCRHGQFVEDVPFLRETLLNKALDDSETVLKHLRERSPYQCCFVELAAMLHQPRMEAELLRLLPGEISLSSRLAILDSLGEGSSPEALPAISQLLPATDRETTIAVIQALGRIASQPALEMLSSCIGQDERMDIMILDIFAAVQDEYSLQKLNQAILSHSAVLRNHAKNRLVDIGVKVVPLLTENLFADNVDLLIHSLNVLKDIGDKSVASSIRKLINTQPDDANVRFAAYETLAVFPRNSGDYVLAGGLNDPDSNVRLAAARAIDKSLDDVMAAGIRNMVKKQNSEAYRIIKAVVDAQTSNIFLNLISIEFVKKVVVEYLGLKVHSEIRWFYCNLLRQAGLEELAVEIVGMAKQKKEKVLAKVCAVDDSGLILRVYRSVLNELGVEPVLFENPLEALAWLKSEKPAVVFTDLNMPQITGIELIWKIREIYSKKELPVIMVTTQGDYEDHRAAAEAGATAIIAKPFNADKLRKYLVL